MKLTAACIARHVGALTIASLCLLLVRTPVADAEPELVEVTPQDGSVLDAAPELVKLCYSEAIKAEEEAWKFSMRAPGNQSLGLRIVFGTDGTCVDVFPGAGEDPPQGIWSLDWQVQAQSDSSEESGVVRFQVGELQPGETPLPEPRDRSEPAGDDDTPTALVALAAVGVAIVVLAAIAFILRRFRGRSGTAN
jgi:methionine-rich copper-binding protein CopC